MYVCQHWGTAQLVFSWCWAHRTDSIKLVNIRAGLRCTVPPPPPVPPVPPVHQPRSLAQPCSRMKNISADTCSRQSQAGGVLSTYLHIYISTYLHTCQDPRHRIHAHLNPFHTLCNCILEEWSHLRVLISKCIFCTYNSFMSHLYSFTYLI